MTGWTMGIEGWLFMGAWIAALLLVVGLLVREPRHDGREEALDSLRRRLSRGEISREEFEATRHLIDP